MSLRILLCVDGSRWSGAASRLALRLLAHVPGAELTALHVVDVVAPRGDLVTEIGGRLGLGPTVVHPDDEAAALVRGQALVDDVVAAAGELPARGTLLRGAVGEVILERAAHADLLVVGMRGLTEEKHPGEGGGQVAHLLQEASVPAIFVPGEGTHLERLAVGYDGSPSAARGVAAIRRIFEGAPVPVHALYVDDGSAAPAALAEVDADLPGFEVEHHVVRGESVHHALVEVAHDLDAGLLVLGFRERTGLRGLLFGSPSDHILARARTAVLVAH